LKIVLVGPIPPTRDGIADHNGALFNSICNIQKDTIIINNYYEFKHFKKVNNNKFVNYIFHLQFGNSHPSSFVAKVFNELSKHNQLIISTLHDTTNTNAAKLIRTALEKPTHLYFEFGRPSIKRIIERSNATIVYSDYLRKQLASKYGHSDSIVVIPHGGNDDFTNMNKIKSRKSLGLDSKEIILCTFGYVTPRKGIEEVIKAVKLYDKSLKYYIIGGFNFPHYKYQIYKLVSKLNLKESVIFCDYQPRNKVFQYLKAADIIIQPRKYTNEGASGSIVPALFAGSPLIATNLPNIQEYIKNGKTGLLVKHDHLAYLNSINKLLESEGYAQLLGIQSRKWAIKNLLWERVARMHVEVYEKYSN
jgi:glycosyltransferase involved in cell wall biosynthesis